MESNFLFQAFVYLLAAVIFVPIAKRLGLGSVLGYLIAGIVIGPFVMGFVGEEGKDIMHFAEFGVVMMLFLVGLELEPSLLWRMRKPIVGLGGLQVLVTTVVFSTIAIFIGLQWNEAIAIGMILAMSSTAIVLQTLNEKGMMQTSAGQNSFAVLLFQDIAVIPILALMPLLVVHQIVVDPAEDHGSTTLIANFPGWLQTLSVLGAVAFIIFAGRTLVRPLLRFVAATRLRELFTATALLLVVGITVLMTLVGLSPALGTFLAGVVLANSEYRHELESDIEPFKGLLLGLFFIAVGASINFRLIIENPLLIAGLVIAIPLIKSLVLFILGKSFKMGTDQNAIFSLGLSQVGEFAFVLLSFVLQLGIINNETVNILMAVVAITMALTPLVNIITERVIIPRVGIKEKAQDIEPDVIDEKNPVIIAGFGRFGSIVGRFLKANDVGTTVLDLDSDRVELLRKLGRKVYYGDATRYDLLKSAGADDAKLIIVTLDTPEKCVALVQTVKKHFPNLQIMVRAYDRPDSFLFMDEGILHIYRETLDTSLRMGVDALNILGHRTYRATRLARTFRKHDEMNMKKLAAVRHDRNEFISTAKQTISELEEYLLADMRAIDLNKDEGWDVESLREEVQNMQFPAPGN
ncbi:MAG: cation:proton antiporter [Bacteroidetes bacterium]|nr:cation:proton antiporter [Bacteroidota bacterium]MBP8915763.1 cation:proton antiporter [Chitinophagales bacterium]